MNPVVCGVILALGRFPHDAAPVDSSMEPVVRGVVLALGFISETHSPNASMTIEASIED